MKYAWTFTSILVLSVSALPSRASEEEAIVYKGEEALKRFLTAYEPEIPFLVEHYVKNRKIRIVKTHYFREKGLKDDVTESEVLSNDTCIRVRTSNIGLSSDQAVDPATAEPWVDTRPWDATTPKRYRPATGWVIFRPDGCFRIADKLHFPKKPLIDTRAELR